MYCEVYSFKPGTVCNKEDVSLVFTTLWILPSPILNYIILQLPFKRSCANLIYHLVQNQQKYETLCLRAAARWQHRKAFDKQEFQYIYIYIFFFKDLKDCGEGGSLGSTAAKRWTDPSSSRRHLQLLWTDGQRGRRGGRDSDCVLWDPSGIHPIFFTGCEQHMHAVMNNPAASWNSSVVFLSDVV